MTKKKLEKPLWLKYTAEEVEEIILKLASKGLTSEKIGLHLRDRYGIPNTKIYNLKISQVLKEKNLYNSPDALNLGKKQKNLEGHIEKNQQDKKAKRSLIITKAKVKKYRDYLNK